MDPAELFSVKDRVVIVTGAASGMGQAMAQGLAAAQAAVVLTDVAAEKVESVAKELRGRGLTAIAIPADLQSDSALVQLTDGAMQQFGRIEGLVNAAGITKGAPAAEYPDADWDYTFRINLVAAFKLCKLVAGPMIRQRHGRIVNITSIGAALGFPNNPAYQAAKGALQQLTRALATDWAQYNIRVNNLCPGHFRTSMTTKSYGNETLRQYRSERCMLGRWGEPDEVVGPAIFLLSEASSYITGNDLFVDGGFAKTGLTAGH